MLYNLSDKGTPFKKLAVVCIVNASAIDEIKKQTHYNYAAHKQKRTTITKHYFLTEHLNALQLTAATT